MFSLDFYQKNLSIRKNLFISAHFKPLLEFAPLKFLELFTTLSSSDYSTLLYR
ncbi:hypothetical protein VAE151_520230 [Vibrio aestuarianus]|uniref:Uncharacterized protein n=1 Tax=Vibrio aestuarianus TaxID=28171 RepID=A0ABN8TP65_9VIBR|nr:hypothetical protein VAE308_1010232 [Vibrio aestuarianus]CAH8186370.1 hypothetical protein VIBAE_A30232 [Vibrio aestuarianus subsp. francensis]CAH8186226.1 hypothetical protein VAE032_240231 [Vibrio aestuarianus]CAH8186326.1 hypothetical protein VAE055_340232 [Vibrio aestuarianus]CAH8186413.1 hypothetical protein VAE128_440233 [Vibrio aestuarianus]